MSITSETHGEHRPKRPRPPGGKLDPERVIDFFEDVIWHNPEVCAHCFARVRRRNQGTVTTRDGKRKEFDNLWRSPNATLGEDLDDPPEDVVGVQPLSKPRTTCEVCGSVGAISQADLLSEQEAADRVPALVERLREQGYSVDVDVLYDVVRHLKSEPEYRSDDKRVFAVAVALGVDRA